MGPTVSGSTSPSDKNSIFDQAKVKLQCLQYFHSMHV